jgi:hypothetical protein
MNAPLEYRYQYSQPATPVHSQYKNNGTTATMTSIRNAASEHITTSSQAMPYLIHVRGAGIACQYPQVTEKVDPVHCIDTFKGLVNYKFSI